MPFLVGGGVHVSLDGQALALPPLLFEASGPRLVHVAVEGPLVEHHLHERVVGGVVVLVAGGNRSVSLGGGGGGGGLFRPLRARGPGVVVGPDAVVLGAALLLGQKGLPPGVPLRHPLLIV